MNDRPSAAGPRLASARPAIETGSTRAHHRAHDSQYDSQYDSPHDRPVTVDDAIDLVAEIAGDVELPVAFENLRLAAAVQELAEAAEAIGDRRMLAALFLLAGDFDLLPAMHWPRARARRVDPRADLLARSRELRGIGSGGNDDNDEPLADRTTRERLRLAGLAYSLAAAASAIGNRDGCQCFLAAALACARNPAART